MLDYETRKQLEEAWLCEMAYELKDAKKIISKNGFELKIHLAKCFLFNDSQWYNHWLKECSTFCMICDDIRVKPKGRRLQSELFLKDGNICSEIETTKDARGYLNLVISKYQDLRSELATDKECSVFLELWDTLRFELANMFTQDTLYDRNDYINVIDKYIKLYIEEEN